MGSPGRRQRPTNKGNEGGNINKQPEFYKDKSSPLHTFKGHAMEGFALAWSPTTTGVMAASVLGQGSRGRHFR